MGWSNLIEGKTILVTGGTGSFGHVAIVNLLKSKPREIRVMARHEDSLHTMARTFPDPRLKFIVGDVRDERRVFEVSEKVDIILHVAALKQVPDCEVHPFEAVKTNILGAENVRRAAIANEVEAVVAISTDKAVKPVNAMGMTKALQEKIMTSNEMQNHKTRFMVVRYGNVMGSTGSVIPLFLEMLSKNQSLVVTDFKMTRFLLSLDDALQLVFTALKHGMGREIFVLKCPACRIKDLAEVIAAGRVDVVEGKIRPGEKIHETLIHEDEMRRSQESSTYYTIFPSDSNTVSLSTQAGEFTSENARRLSKEELKALLKQHGWIK